MTRSQRTQSVAGRIILATSVVHLSVTFVDYDQLSLRALWFVGSGFALLLIGGLNVITSGLEKEVFEALRGLRYLTLVSDACGVALGGLFIALTGAAEPQGPVLVLLFLTAGIAQLRRA
jgi:hypothetical protein